MAKPIIKASVTSFEGKIAYYVIDVDQFPTIAEEFQVMAIPAVFGKHGMHVHRLKGSPHNQNDVTAFIKTILAEKPRRGVLKLIRDAQGMKTLSWFVAGSSNAEVNQILFPQEA